MPVSRRAAPKTSKGKRKAKGTGKAQKTPRTIERARPRKTKKAQKTSTRTASARAIRVAPSRTSTPPKRRTAQKRIALPSSDPIPTPRPSVPVGPPIVGESGMHRPVESALAIIAQIPTERPLTDEERDAMAKVALTAQRHLGIDGVPETIALAIGTFVDDVRAGKRPEPKGQDLRLGLGVLWGEQVRAQVGWRWVHLTYPNGFASYALVPDDRAFACFPLNRLPELMRGRATNTSARLFQRIRTGELPARRENAYLVIG